MWDKGAANMTVGRVPLCRSRALFGLLTYVRGMGQFHTFWSSVHMTQMRWLLLSFLFYLSKWSWKPHQVTWECYGNHRQRQSSVLQVWTHTHLRTPHQPQIQLNPESRAPVSVFSQKQFTSGGILSKMPSEAIWPQFCLHGILSFPNLRPSQQVLEIRKPETVGS